MQKDPAAQTHHASMKASAPPDLFIGRKPASEMERSGIELHCERKKRKKVQKAWAATHHACMKASAPPDLFIGCKPASEMERSGIELHCERKRRKQLPCGGECCIDIAIELKLTFNADWSTVVEIRSYWKYNYWRDEYDTGRNAEK